MLEICLTHPLPHHAPKILVHPLSHLATNGLFHPPKAHVALGVYTAKKSCPCKKTGKPCTERWHPRHKCTNVATKKEKIIRIDCEKEKGKTTTPSPWRKIGGIQLNLDHKRIRQASMWVDDQLITAYESVMLEICLFHHLQSRKQGKPFRRSRCLVRVLAANPPAPRILIAESSGRCSGMGYLGLRLLAATTPCQSRACRNQDATELLAVDEDPASTAVNAARRRGEIWRRGGSRGE